MLKNKSDTEMCEKILQPLLKIFESHSAVRIALTKPPGNFRAVLEGTCEDLNALHEPLFLDVVVDTLNPPDDAITTTATEVQLESSEPNEGSDEINSLPFSCPKCPKSFQFKSRLQRHLTTHQVLTIYHII